MTMLGKSSGYEYQCLSQRDTVCSDTPGLFSSHAAFTYNNYDQRGLSFDYVPKVSQNDFTDKSQGLLSWICNLIVMFLVLIFTFITFPISGWFVLKVVPNYERIVVFRLGRIRPPKGPGVVLVLPLIDQWQKVDLRTRAFNVPPCKVTTKDGGLVSVGADMRGACVLQMDMNEMTKPWGLEVDRVELILEGVLREPDGGHAGPVIMPPSVPGLEGLTGPIPQLAMHFLSQTAASQSSQDSVSFADELCVDGLMDTVQSVLSEQLVHQVQASYCFQITTDSGQINSYYVDLTQALCCVCVEVLERVEGASRHDLLAMFEGGLRPFAAYSSGRLRVQGDLNTSMKLETLIKLLKTT
uniref:Stomatin (EPB72)-like 1 n=1 Tax=Sinocyclocheilus anshuiensis TaxID=1608454 RepID=A0A671N5Y3_9TELE